MTQNTILEDTTGANAPNIATTDENLSVDSMFQQKSLPSLGRQIFSVIDVNGPTAALFNIKTKASKDGFELVRAEVEVFPSKSINTGIVEESIQDIFTQYGKDAQNVIGTMLRGLANQDENEKTLQFLENKSLSTPNLTLSDSTNARNNLFEISQKVQELVLKANSKYMRTFSCYCVLPQKFAASILSLDSYINGHESEVNDLFVGTVGKTKFYMSTDPTSTMAYVGLKDEIDASKSSAVFSPYTSNVTTSQDPDTGEQKYFIFNRYAITQSPLHTVGDELMFKFNIQD